MTTWRLIGHSSHRSFNLGWQSIKGKERRETSAASWLNAKAWSPSTVETSRSSHLSPSTQGIERGIDPHLLTACLLKASVSTHISIRIPRQSLPSRLSLSLFVCWAQDEIPSGRTHMVFIDSPPLVGGVRDFLQCLPLYRSLLIWLERAEEG